MSEEDIIVLPDEEGNEPPAPELPPEAPAERPLVFPVVTPVKKPTKFDEAWFARFNGKAPHYKLAGNASIHGVDRADFYKCEKFPGWAKPKRFGFTVEWAEEMRTAGKLVRLELPFED